MIVDAILQQSDDRFWWDAFQHEIETNFLLK